MSANCCLVSRPSSCKAPSILRWKASTDITQESLTDARIMRNIAEKPVVCIHIAASATEYLSPSRDQRRPAMGPFPHDAPPATISADNPMGTDGFEFVEYTHPNPEALHTLFKLMGYVAVARHKTKKITVYRQGDINYLVNEQPGTHGFDFVSQHGP